MSLDFDTLRSKNDERSIIWGDETDVEFASIELFGETGEVANEIKKLIRFQHGMAGGKDNMEDVGDEIADVIISADLLARKLNINLGDVVRRKFNKTSDKHGFEVKL